MFQGKFALRSLFLVYQLTNTSLKLTWKVLSNTKYYFNFITTMKESVKAKIQQLKANANGKKKMHITLKSGNRDSLLKLSRLKSKLTYL